MKKWKYVNAKRISADAVEFSVITLEDGTVEQEDFKIEKEAAFSKFTWQTLTDNRAGKNLKIDPDFPYIRGWLEAGYTVGVIIDHNGESWYQSHRGGFRSDILQTVEFSPLTTYQLG